MGNNLTPQQMLQQYLIASYGYYIMCRPIMTDSEYDRLGKSLLEHWGTFEHQHKHLITEDDLRAGTLFTLGENDYPQVVIGAYYVWLDEMVKYHSGRG